MAYEFKRLSDVESVAEPTESANVLIEENGVIKKAPKTAVGGSGGSVGYDAVIALEATGDAETPYTINLMSGGFDNIKGKIDNQNMPKVLIIISVNNGLIIAHTESINCMYVVPLNQVGCLFFNEQGKQYGLVIASDNSMTVSSPNT